MDNIDQKIIQLLKQNSKMTNKAIGEQIHMSGQAVGNRIIKLQESGAIKNFSISINYPQTQFIRIFMNSNRFKQFEKQVNQFEPISEFYKISGGACYLIIAHFETKQLVEFLEIIDKWCRYSIETVIEPLK
ncbi:MULTISPECIES: AsnC family transcriptional regulator [unclassified Enterococcus]|uniref:Lrp/AsnC family transcriptional regulator n=1 Tax=unclassified Enterococcus TaxID=2608891 RepID=UPI001552E100|nr:MULTISPECIES: AsnC family transcriptional regulator [unclassified Enterococcus]MBS7577615.1 AsnC family transcriptional regulator [Enterococcus sp. MMGLQ5-2]MBS7584886.1 AsnC family transcriptional regulator [Enterococcus sp. MMGLQ5-1]